MEQVKSKKKYFVKKKPNRYRKPNQLKSKQNQRDLGKISSEEKLVIKYLNDKLREHKLKQSRHGKGFHAVHCRSFMGKHLNMTPTRCRLLLKRLKIRKIIDLKDEQKNPSYEYAFQFVDNQKGNNVRNNQFRKSNSKYLQLSEISKV